METEKRVCKGCGEAKPLDGSFDKVGSKEDGSPYYRWKCHQCRQGTKDARRIKNAETFAEWKKQLKCSDPKCGNSDFRVLEFHHKGDKDGNIADMIATGYSLQTVMEEAAKCTVLCANCHRILHWEEKFSRSQVQILSP